MKRLQRLSLAVILIGLAFISCIDDEDCCCPPEGSSQLAFHVSTDASITSFRLWEEGNFNNAYDLSSSNGQWMSYPEMANVSELSAQTLYYARHTPTETDPLTGHSDILVAGPSTLAGIALGLQFEHLMAQLEIVLLPGRGFEGSLEGATIRFDLINTYTLNEANVFTPGSEMQTLTFAAANPYIVVPQSIRERLLTVVLADGTEYTGTLKELDLVNGRKTQLAITLRHTDMPVVISVGEAAWGETLYAEAEISKKIGLSEHDCRKLPGTGTLILSITSDDGTTRQATYYWNGEELVCLDEALYWDDFAEDKTHIFDFTYIPDGPATPELDTLIGESEGTGWGEEIYFPELSHTNSRLTILLQQGTGWLSATEFEEWINAGSLRLTGLSESSYTYPYQTEGQVNSVIVLPQEITEKALAELSLRNDRYTLRLYDLLPDNILLAGRQYVITATVHKMEDASDQRLSITLSIGEIADWGDIINGTGVFQ